MSTMIWLCIGVLCAVFALGVFCGVCAVMLSGRISRAEERRQ